MSSLTDHLADLLILGSQARAKTFLPTPRAGSPADIDRGYCERVMGSTKASDRVHLCSDVFTAVSVDVLDALAVHVRERDTIFALFPLMRTVVENAVGVLWILDPDATNELRWARGALLEWDAESRDLDMISHWLDKTDPLRVEQKARRRRLLDELTATFPAPAGGNNLGGKPYRLLGEEIPLIEDNVSRYLDAPEGSTWKGVYGYLCSKGTHASFGSAHFIDTTYEPGRFTLPGDRLVWLVRATLAAHARSLETVAQWRGYDLTTIDDLIDAVAELDPMLARDE